MSLTPISAAVGLAVVASTGMLGFSAVSDPAAGTHNSRSVVVRVASIDPAFNAAASVGQPVAVVPVALPPPSRTTSNEPEQLQPSGLRQQRKSQSPAPQLAAPMPPAGPVAQSGSSTGLQPVAVPAMLRWPAPPPSSQPAMAPQPISAPAQSPQRLNMPMPVPMPQATPMAPPTTPPAARTQPAAVETPATQVHAFDGIVASERALLRRTATSALYEAHIASTATAAEAEALWADLSARLGNRLAGASMHLKHIDVPQHGRFVRLLAGDFNDAGSTADFCRAVIALGRDCRIMRKLEIAG